MAAERGAGAQQPHSISDQELGSHFDPVLSESKKIRRKLNVASRLSSAQLSRAACLSQGTAGLFNRGTKAS